MWKKLKKENWRLKLGFIKPYEKVSKEQYRKDMAELTGQKQKKDKGDKGVSDKKAQTAYFNKRTFCEVCFHEGRGKASAIQVHEIEYRSQGGKCVEENMIFLCQNDHDRAHFKRKPYLHKDRLLEAKRVVEEALKKEAIQ